jgi:hypothetical protein
VMSAISGARKPGMNVTCASRIGVVFAIAPLSSASWILDSFSTDPTRRVFAGRHRVVVDERRCGIEISPRGLGHLLSATAAAALTTWLAGAVAGVKVNTVAAADFEHFITFRCGGQNAVEFDVAGALTNLSTDSGVGCLWSWRCRHIKASVSLSFGGADLIHSVCEGVEPAQASW